MVTPSKGKRKQDLIQREQRFIAILKFIEWWWKQNGIAPSERDISSSTGVPYGSMTRYLKRLHDEGYIEHVSPLNVYRNYRTTGKRYERKLT